jgi:hypothetical protein
MILPIFISVSLAPGSYFFCALAAVTVIAATTAKVVRPIKLLVRAGIVSLPLGSFSFAQVSQVARGHASKHRLIPRRETALLRLANYD